MKLHQTLITSILLFISSTFALDLDISSYDSINDAAKLLADGLMDYYWGYDYGGTVGMFTHPYYWWEAGGAFGSMIDYCYFFENTTYEPVIMQSMLYQASDTNDYMPLNQTVTEGNDDQVFWGIAAIQAAERNFTNPPNGSPSWLSLAQAVFNKMKNNWDNDTCGGGLRWQIVPWNSGYDYKNTVSNAGLFHLGARLLRYTGNDTYYREWCELSYDWMLDIGFIVESPHYYAYDGANTETNCTNLTVYQWTYNAALILSGCAYMYNYTEETIWLTRTEGFLKGISIFFDSGGVMYEAACQSHGTCQTDQRSFRAYLARFMGLTAVLVPSTYDTIIEHLETTAKGVAISCSGGYDGHTCGQNWSYGGWDGLYGLGEQMSSLEVIQNLLILDRPAPYTQSDGGSSTGDVLAGNATVVATNKPLNLDKGDTAGASIITVVFSVTIIALGFYVIV